MRLASAFVNEEQNLAERVKNTVRFQKPMSVMKVVRKEIMKGVLKKTAAVATVALTTAAMSVPTLTAPAQSQSQEMLLQMDSKLRTSNIGLLIGPNVNGYTMRTRQPVTDSIYEKQTFSTYWYTFIAGPGPLGVDILQRPNNYSTTTVGYFGKDFSCRDFLGGKYNRRDKCNLSRPQPVVIGISFSHDRGEPRPFKFRIRGYSGIIQQQHIEPIMALKESVVARVKAGAGGADFSPKPRFCSIANGRCW